MTTTSQTPATLREFIDLRSMTGYQIAIIAIMTLLNALDGYDVLAMSFTAAAVSREFGISETELGLLLSSGLVGMAIGAIGLGPLADRVGRKNMLLIALGLNIVGLALSALAPTYLLLMAARVITGLGIGGMLAGLTVITSEYANTKRRGFAIAVTVGGYPVGATFGGMLANWLIHNFSWHLVFLAGTVFSLLALLLVVVVVPESIDFLTTRGDERSLARASVIAKRLGWTGEVVKTEHAAEDKAGFAALFRPGVARSTIALWCAFFLVMFGFYFANTWTPKMFTNIGFPQDLGITAGIMLTVGGAFGSLAFGYLTSRLRPRLLLATFGGLAAIAMAGFILSTEPAKAALDLDDATGPVIVTLVLGVVLGFLINGAVAGLYVVAPAAYGARARSTGLGVAMGIGRAGAIVAPIMAGVMLDASFTPVTIFLTVAVIVVLAAGAALFVREHRPGSGSGQTSAIELREMEVAAAEARAEASTK